MKKAFPVILAVLFLLAVPFAARAWVGAVVSVEDGDTITVFREHEDGGKERVRIRLYGVDTPELGFSGVAGQPYSAVARRFVMRLLGFDREKTPTEPVFVTILEMGIDRYTRTVAGVVSLPDGKVVQEELLRAGLAWVYPKYCPDCRQWKALQEAAKAAGRGIWSRDDPIAPWQWRKEVRR